MGSSISNSSDPMPAGPKISSMLRLNLTPSNTKHKHTMQFCCQPKISNFFSISLSLSLFLTYPYTSKISPKSTPHVFMVIRRSFSGKSDFCWNFSFHGVSLEIFSTKNSNLNKRSNEKNPTKTVFLRIQTKKHNPHHTHTHTNE